MVGGQASQVGPGLATWSHSEEAGLVTAGKDQGRKEETQPDEITGAKLQKALGHWISMLLQLWGSWITCISWRKLEDLIPKNAHTLNALSSFQKADISVLDSQDLNKILKVIGVPPAETKRQLGTNSIFNDIPKADSISGQWTPRFLHTLRLRLFHYPHQFGEVMLITKSPEGSQLHVSPGDFLLVIGFKHKTTSIVTLISIE